MRARYISAMDKLYFLCIAIGVVSVVCMTVLIFTGVVMRYIFHVGAQFAEPMSIFFAVQLTMYGAAACYRARAHLGLELFVAMLPSWHRRIVQWTVLLLLAALATFMIVYGISLTNTTWFQAYPEFTYIRVGFVYSAIPGSGLVMLLFVIEAAFFHRNGSENGELDLQHRVAQAGTQAQKLTS